MKLVHVVQGEFAVSADPDAVLTTVLGSCVATCLWDPDARVGGMNHFLLPGDGGPGQGTMTNGVHAMELLINALLKHGARKDRLEAKLFGGARMLRGLADIGGKNADFGRRFLALEQIKCVNASLGGVRARRIRFWPVSGRASQLLLAPSEFVEPKLSPAKSTATASTSQDIELF